MSGPRASRTAFLAVVLLAAAGAATGQVLDVTDVSPDQSNLDASDPDGASGGRINGLAVVPGDDEVFYAASEWGGLFTSRDGGDSWMRLDGHLPVATWDVEVDPDEPNRVYATSYYDGKIEPLSGINVSTDGGATWRRPATATPAPEACLDRVDAEELFAFGIAVDPDDTARVYVGTSCGLAISTDRGATWAFVDPAPDGGGRTVWDVVVHHGGIIDLCGDDGHRRSVDGGARWTGASSTGQLPSGRCSIAASPHEADTLFAVSGTTIFESNDGGGTWQNRYLNPRPQGRFPFVATNERGSASYDLWFGDVQLHRRACTTPIPAPAGAAARCLGGGWIGPFTRRGPDGVRSADDGGHDDLGDIAFDSDADIDACPRIFSSDGGIYVNTRTTSPACHNPRWRQPTVTPHALWVWDFEGVGQPGEDAEDLYMGLQDNGSFGSRDAGLGDASWNNNQCCDTHEIAADPARVVWSVCCGASLLRSAPGIVGRNGVNQAPGGLRLFERLDSIVNIAGNDYLMASGGGVFFTANVSAGAVRWTGVGVATTPRNACGVRAALDGEDPTVFAKSGDCQGEIGGQLFRHDGTGLDGAWNRVDRPGAGLFGVYDVDPGDPDRIFAADLAGADPEMVLTEDGGATWTPLPALDDLMTAGGTIRSRTRRGPTTRQTNAVKVFSGYPQPTMVAFDAEDDEVMLAGGADSGVFLSVDGGAAWERLTDPPAFATACTFHLPRPRFAHFDHDTAGRIRAYVASQGRGVWRLSFTKDRSKLGTNEAGDAFASAVAGGDFDGDGFDDLAVGAPGEARGGSPATGSVFVYKGTSTGLRPWHALDQTGLGADEAGDLFGAALAAGDFDGDGLADLAVGAPGESPGASPGSGFVFLFRGGAAGLEPWRGLDQADLGANEAGDRFGVALAAGDFDGDGRDDLAVGAPGEAPGNAPRSGAVYAFRGGANDVQPWRVIDQAGLGSNEAGDEFGTALAAGDFTGDGLADLAVGAPGESPGASPASGAVFSFRGDAAGPVALAVHDQDSTGLGTNEAGDRFGAALAVGDFSGDGRADLAVGAPGEAPGPSPRSGVVFVFRGEGASLAGWRLLDQNGLGVNEEDDRFGAALAAGDLDGDGVADLAVGAPGEELGAAASGVVFLFRGAAAGPASWRLLDQAGLGANEPGDRFGAALAAGDFSGDGVADLSVGAPGESPGGHPQSGHLFTYRGFPATVAPCRGLNQES